MRLFDAQRLAWSNLRAAWGRNLAAIIVIGVLFGLLMGVEFVLAGLENTLERYANEQTNNNIYIATETVADLAEFGGIEIAEIDGDLRPTEGRLMIAENQTIENLNLMDFLLDGIGEGSMRGLVRENGVYRLRSEDGRERFLVRFVKTEQAYQFLRNAAEKNRAAHEVISNHTGIYGRFLQLRSAVRVIKYILLVVAVIITVFTLAHLLSQEVTTVALYRALGATTGEVMAVYFLVLLGLVVGAVIFAVGLGLILAAVVTVMNAGALGALLPRFYQVASMGPVVLIGLNSQILIIMGLMILVAPMSFLLMIDQISGKKLARRMKE